MNKTKKSTRSIYDEQACQAILRPAWSQPCQEVSVRWPTPELEIDLSSNQQSLWSGVWAWSVSLDGQALVSQSTWEVMCWERNEEAVFLELQLRLSAGFCLQRQIMLARKDRFLLLADAVFGQQRGMLAYQSQLPLGSGVQLRPARSTREGTLLSAKCSHALVLPLALPEWRAEQGVGELLQEEQNLTWFYASKGHALYAPLFFDLDPRRMAQPCTWRQLSVAENRSNVPRDVAAGFRVQLADKQWLIYRSLGRQANRTLLGHNLSTEMLVGRFLKSGLVRPLVEIE